MANQINGTKGGDELQGVAGDDEINGRRGADTLQSAASSADPSTVGSDTVNGGKGSDLIDITGLGNSHKGFGDEGPDFILFGAGADTAFGGAGNDVLRWSAGTGVFELDTDVDKAFGGKGRDFLTVNFSLITGISAMEVTGNAGGTRTITADGETVMQFSGMEDIDFQLPDGADLDGFVGGSGNEQIQVSSGRHRAEMKRGDDIFAFTLDDQRDVIDMGLGNDFVLVFYGDSTGDLVVDLKKGTFKSDGKSLAKVENGKLFQISGTGDTDDKITGSKGNDTIDSGGGSDTLKGLGGDDYFVLSVLGGESIARGAAGVDTLEIADANLLESGETIDMSGTGNGTVQVSVGGSNVITGEGVEKVVANGSAGDDKLIGMADADTLSGGAGDDTINGFGGADEIVHQGGRDKVKGGGGADTFVFGVGAQGDGVMLINDFKAADSLALIAVAFNGDNFVVGEAPAFASGAGLKTASGSGSQLIYNTSDGRLYLDIDGEGGADADLLARLRANGDAADLSVDQIDII